MYEGHYEAMADLQADWQAEQRGMFDSDPEFGNCTCGRRDCYECADDDQED